MHVELFRIEPEGMRQCWQDEFALRTQPDPGGISMRTILYGRRALVEEDEDEEEEEEEEEGGEEGEGECAHRELSEDRL